MNLRNFVEGLTIEERTELLDILTENSLTWTTMPPHMEDIAPQEVVDRKNKTEDFTMHKNNSISNKKKEPVVAKQNMWSDTGEDRNIVTPEITKTPRTRKPPAKKTVTCNACGKKESLNASLVYGEYYRCNSCLGNK
jgi:hypothetical protein